MARKLARAPVPRPLSRGREGRATEAVLSTPPRYNRAAGRLSSRFLRSAKLGAGEERAWSSRVRAANGGGTEKVPAWAPWRVPRAPASSSAAGSAREWPPDPGSGPESFRLFLALLPLECAVANSGENDPCLLGVRP